MEMEAMTFSLAHMPCIPCNADSQPVSFADRSLFLTRLPRWQLVSQNGGHQLQRIVLVKDFQQALGLAVRIGELAEHYQHHPRLCVEWGKVSIAWWTHQLNDLHHNDFVLAAKTELLLADFAQTAHA